MEIVLETGQQSPDDLGGVTWLMQVHEDTGQFLGRIIKGTQSHCEHIGTEQDVEDTGQFLGQIIKGAQSHCEHIGTEQDVAMATKRITVTGWQAAKNHYNI